MRARELDLGWVYGLMRQESRFVVPARSSVGACWGLMQVMPAAGKWVADRIGLAGYSQRLLTDPETNVLLGFQLHAPDHGGARRPSVLASAGYNAGPGRARRWRARGAGKAQIHAETIPFDETRDYVKKVLANAVILGDPARKTTAIAQGATRYDRARGGQRVSFRVQRPFQPATCAVQSKHEPKTCLVHRRRLGFIGSAIANRLCKEGVKVLIPTRRRGRAGRAAAWRRVGEGSAC